MLTAAEALVWALRTGRTERLSLEMVNDGPVLGTPLAWALLAAGFYSSPSGLRYQGSLPHAEAFDPKRSIPGRLWNGTKA